MIGVGGVIEDIRAAARLALPHRRRLAPVGGTEHRHHRCAQGRRHVHGAGVVGQQEPALGQHRSELRQRGPSDRVAERPAATGLPAVDAFQFVDAANGWAWHNASHSLAHTTDGGVTWQPQSTGTTTLAEGQVSCLGRDVIHSVVNPLASCTAAIHVYGGDFFGTERSEWNVEGRDEHRFDVVHAMEQFDAGSR